MKTVYRKGVADYLNVGTTGEPKYVLMGVGFESLDEEPGAKTETTCYIHESTSSSTITQYETKFPYKSEVIADEEAIMSLYKTGRDHEIGEAAEREYVRVDLYETTSSENTYKARKFRVCNEISSFTGEGGGKLKVEGTLNAVGDPIQGTFNVSTKTFAPAGAAAAASIRK